MGADATLRMILLGEDRSAGKTLKNVGDESERTKSKLHTLSSVAGKALAGGLLIAGAAAVKLAKGAAEDEAAASKLADTMKKAAGATSADVAATEDWITAKGKALGVSDDELRPALSKLVVATKDVDKAQRLASLAMDVSAGSGKDLGTVSAALAKAQNGNVGALGKLGIATKDADGHTKSLHDITKDLAATYGGAAATAAETTAGKQKRLTVALSEAGETIGYKVLPAMLALTDAAMAALGWMESHQKLVVIVGGALLGLVVAVWAVNAAVRAYTAVQAALNAVMSANPIGLVVLAIAALVAGFIIAYNKSETFRSIVDGAMRGVATAVDFARDHWQLLLALLLGPFGVAIGLVISHFNELKSVAGSVIRFVVGAFLDLVGAIIHGAADAFGWVPGLGGKLRSAAANFDEFRDHVNASLAGIDGDKKVTITATYIVKQVGNVPLYKSNATGTNFYTGGMTRVGERGPEIVDLPRGSRVYSAQDSAAMGGGGGGDFGTMTLVLKSDTGELIEQKLIKFQRDQGGRPLAIVTS